MHTAEHRIRKRAILDTRSRGPHLRRYPDRSSGDALYVELLGGREVWTTDSVKVRGTRWFLIGDDLLEVGPTSPPDATPQAVLEVDELDEVLERAWNAGYRVDVDEASGVTACIVAPGGRRIRVVERRR